MRSVSSALSTQLADDNCALIACFTIDAPTPIYRCLWASDTTFDGVTYTADTGSFAAIPQDLKLARPEYELSLQNVTDGTTPLPWTAYVAANDLTNVEVILRVVEASLLADTDAVVQEARWHIAGVALDHEFVRFRLLSPMDGLAVEVPRFPIGGQTCGWNYKRGPCTSQSGYTFCGKTLDDCSKRFPSGSVLPFGPSYPFMSRLSRGRL